MCVPRQISREGWELSGLLLAEGLAAEEGQVVVSGQDVAARCEEGGLLFALRAARRPVGWTGGHLRMAAAADVCRAVAVMVLAVPLRGQAERGYRDLFVICCLPPRAWHLRVFRA